VLLEHGQVAAAGPIGEVVRRYLDAGAARQSAARFEPRGRTGLGWARVTDVRLVDESDRPVAAVPCDQALSFELALEVSDAGESGGSLRGLVLELTICSEAGEPLLSVMNVDHAGVELPAARACRVQVRLPAPTFRPGRYRLDLFLGRPYLQHVDDIADALRFDILPPDRPWRPYPLEEGRGVFLRQADWTCFDQSWSTRAGG
jgi:hypothetical protein